MIEKDYYELLEVSRDCNGDELKKSYRRLAMKYHPDRNPDDQDSEMRFKEINEAYEVLKDDQKRAAYDRYGHEAFKQNAGMGGGGNPFGGFEFNFGSGGFSDIFENIFADFMGGGRAQQRSYAQAGADLRYNLEISLEESFFGIEKAIKIPASKVCENCHGHGTANGKEPEVCPNCRGSGKVRQAQGAFIYESACPQCRGTGRLIKEACKICKGAGVVGEEKVINLKVPAGIEDDTRMRVSGGGEAGLHGGPNGDLYVFISVKAHKLYSREGANLFVQIPISMTCAALGGKIEIPAIDGEKIELDIVAGSQTDQQHKVRNQGMPMLRSKNRGDLFVRLRVETPVNLSAKQKELLEEFRSISKDDNCQPESKGFFDKIKDLFNSVA